MSGSMISMMDHLSKIRMDKSFRLSFLFKENAQRFIETYIECRPRMLHALSNLEQSAVKLDSMKMGSSISTVAGSSVGATGCVVSIVGLSLAPFTAGASLALTITGAVLGCTSAVNSLVTAITEIAVNKRQGGNANHLYQKFMEDVQAILDCMEQAASTEGPVVHYDVIDTAFDAGKVIVSSGAVGKCIDTIVDGVSALKNLSSEEVAMSAVRLGLKKVKAARNIPNLPDIGKLAKGTPLALSKAARAGCIAMNALFIGLDAFLVCKESVSLAKGKKSEMSKLLRSRSSLWCAEILGWGEIYDYLWKGKDTFTENMNILYQPLSV